MYTQICWKLVWKSALDYAIGIALIYGSRLVMDGEITVGELVAFNGYIALFVDPVNWIPQIISAIKRAQISYKRLDKLYQLQPEKTNETKILEIQKLKGDIEIKELTFSYGEETKPVLNNINLKIKSGQTLGIIGTIGSGKTTLMNLLTRLYSVPNGKIMVRRKRYKWYLNRHTKSKYMLYYTRQFHIFIYHKRKHKPIQKRI